MPVQCTVRSLVFLVTQFTRLAGLWSMPLALLLGGGEAAEPEYGWQRLSSGIPGQVGVVAIALSPACPDLAFMATSSPGGLYLSLDGGVEWQSIASGLSDVGVTSIAAHPTRPSAAYAGTTNGLYRAVGPAQVSLPCAEPWSAKWEHLAGLNASHIYAVLIDPNPPQRVLVGSEEGLFSSENDRDWRQAQEVTAPVLSLARSMSGDLYAATAGQGLMVSHDRGLTWRSVSGLLGSGTFLSVRTMPQGELYCWADDHLLVRGPAAETRVGRRDRDANEPQWRGIDLPGNWQPFSFTVGRRADSSSAQDGAVVMYVGSRGKGILISHDLDSARPNWHRVAAQLSYADITCLEVHPTNPDIAFAGTRFHGLYRTTDGGANWQLVSEEVGPAAVLSLVQHPARPAEFFAGTVGGLYKTSDAGQSWHLLTDELGRLIVQGVAVDHAHPEHLYIATHIGVFASRDEGNTWYWPTEKLGKIHTFNITVARSSPPGETTVLYAGSWGNNLLRSVDGGLTWLPIHSGLETLTVHAFAQHPARPDTLFAGTVERIYKSEDGGASWVQVGRGMREGVTTFALAIDGQQPGHIYAGTTAGIYRSDNDGETWKLITADSLDSTVTALAIRPDDSAILYAGTEHSGLYVSLDAGEHWSRDGLPETSVYAIWIDQAGNVWLGTDQGVFRRRLVR